MSASLGIDRAITSLCQVTGVTDADLRSTAIATLLVAVGGAGIGLIYVCLRALLTKLLGPRLPSPDDTVPIRRRVSRPTLLVPATEVDPGDEAATVPGTRPVPADLLRVSETQPTEGTPRTALAPWLPAVSMGRAGESWLKDYLAKLSSVLPGIHGEASEDQAAPGDLAREVPSAFNTIAASVPRNPDATLEMDAPTLATMMDLSEVVGPPLVWQEAPRSPDRTVKMAALTSGHEPPPMPAARSPVIEMEVSRDLASFQYGARRA
jgi:hypothetical protein